MSEAAEPGDQHVLLCARGLRKSFPAGGRRWSREPSRFLALDDVSLTVYRGETVGIVGESGSGKTTLARTLVGLYKPSAGEICFDNDPLTGFSQQAWRRLRRRVQLVFQDPASALDPRLPVRRQVTEALEIHNVGAHESRVRETARVLSLLNLDEHLWDRRPRELSGGQKQRFAIARALVLDPDLLILDEPVSALDASIQAQIVNLLMAAQQELGVTYVIVSHDLRIIKHMSDRIYVMYLGRVVEHGAARDVFDAPRHPYTRMLLDALPVPDPSVRMRPHLIGEAPSPASPPTGCHFHTRCPHAAPQCREKAPPYAAGRTAAACWFPLSEGRS